MKPKTLTILLASAVFLTCSCAYTDAQEEASHTDNAGQFTAGTYNILWNGYKGNAWEIRRELVAQLLKEGDVFGLQECGYEQYMYLADKLKDSHVSCGFPVRESDWGKEPPVTLKENRLPVKQGINEAIFFNKHKFRKLSEGDLWISDTPETRRDSWGPNINWVTLQDKTTGLKFRFYNTHFWKGSQNAAKRAKGINVIKRHATSSEDSLPFIFTADTNAIDESKPESSYHYAVNGASAAREPFYKNIHTPWGTFNTGA